MPRDRLGMRAAMLAISYLLNLSQPAMAQRLGQGSDVEISVWRIVAALVLCTMLAVGGAFLLKARQGSIRLVSFLPKQNRRLRLVESLRLGPQADLSIVECDGRELLIASSPQGTRLLANLPLAENGEPGGQVQ